MNKHYKVLTSIVHTSTDMKVDIRLVAFLQADKKTSYNDCI